MDNFVEEPIGNPENPKEPEYKVFYSNTDKNPLSPYTVTYNLLKSHFKFPVQIKDDALDSSNQKLPNSLKVIVDSEETRSKVRLIFQNLSDNDVFSLIESVGAGRPWNIEKILEGDFPEYLRHHPITKKLTKIADPDFLPVVKRAFMSSYEMHKKLKKINMTPAEDAACKKLYVELNEEGIRPLTSETAGGLLAPVIQKILDEHPELRPNPPEESDF